MATSKKTIGPVKKTAHAKRPVSRRPVAQPVTQAVPEQLEMNFEFDDAQQTPSQWQRELERLRSGAWPNAARRFKNLHALFTLETIRMSVGEVHLIACDHINHMCGFYRHGANSWGTGLARLRDVLDTTEASAINYEAKYHVVEGVEIIALRKIA